MRGLEKAPDYDYTHGTRVDRTWAGAPAPLRRLFGRPSSCASAEGRRSRCVAPALALGQEIYTPRTEGTSPVPGERPYAGWLYAAAAARLIEPGHVRSLGAELGVTGPPSLAEPVQAGVHRLLSNQGHIGWSYQIPAALDVTARYGEARWTELSLGRSAAAAATLRWGAAAGTVVTALSAGVDLALGLRGDLPWTPAEPEVERPLRLYALARYRQDAVVHDVFVEGRGRSGRAERLPFVGQAELGVGYRRRALALEYRHVMRGREYTAQPASHAYGSLALTVHGF